MGHKRSLERGDFVGRKLLCTCCRKTLTSRLINVPNLTRMSEQEKTLTINEIYHSIQGESTWAGQPCVFVRLSFCDLRCNYCATEYDFYEGKKQALNEI